MNGIAFLTIRKRLENTGNVPIDIAAEALSVYGERIVPSSKGYNRIETSTSVQVRADVPRKPVTLLYSFAKLRSGAVGGNQKTNFFLSAHSSAEEDLLVAVPVKSYPVVLIVRKDYVGKAPIRPKIPIQIVRTQTGRVRLKIERAPRRIHTRDEYPIRPR